MNEITLTKNREKPVLNVWQWDKGQKLTIKGLDLTDCTMQWSGSYLPTGTTTDNREFVPLEGKTDLESGGVCDIPDAGLEDDDLLTGYIYSDINGECETVAKVTVQPVPRAMPADYVSPSNTVTLTVLIEGIVSEAIDEADLVPYTGAAKTVDLNYQDLTGLKNIKSANGIINEEESGQFAFGGQVNTSAAHAFAMGDELSNSQIASAIFGFGGIMPINGRFAVATGTQNPTYVEQKIGFWVDKNGNTYVGNMNHLGAGGFNLALFTMVDGQLLYDGEPITGESFDNAEVLAKFTEENDQLYFDGMPISGVNVAKYETVDELDTNEDLIIAQVATTQESWRSARRKQDATFTFVEVPKMPIEDFTATATFDGELFCTFAFSANDDAFSEEGIGSFTVTVPNSEMAGTIYVYVEHTTTVTAFDVEITFGWNRVTYTLVDEELVLGTISHFPDANFTALPEFTELIINATNGALTGLQEFITTDTTNNEKTALRWIREEGIYIVNTDGDWRKYTSSYIADDYNRLPDDAPIGSTAITLADVEQDKEPEQFETGVTYDYWYFRRDPVIPEINIDSVFDCNYNGVVYDCALKAGETALTTSDVSGGTSGFYVQMHYNGEVLYRYYIIYTIDSFIATIEGETIALSAGWNGVRADYANDVWTLTNLNLTFETLFILSDCHIDAFVNPVFADYLDGFFSTTPYITRKAGGYTKLESGWEETVCIDPLVEVKASKVTTIDANSTDEEYPSAKAVYDFVPTMTEYDADDGLTLNKGNYWTTTASIEFGLPTPVAGKVNTFDLDLTVANAAHAITWSAAVEWAGAVAHVFGAGHHIVSGQYSPVSSKWVLVGSAVGVTA